MTRRLIVILCVAGWLCLPATFVDAQTSPPSESQVVELSFGVSIEGRPITGTRIGVGSRKLYVVANTHGGPEANTYELALALQNHFRNAPQEVPTDVSLYIIPTINPDGLALGTRFNSRGVDLNRNMNTNLDQCPENNWQQTVQGAYGYVSDTGGPYMESEWEAQLVREIVLDASAVIWLHSSGGNVFPAFCEHQPSIELAQVYAEASGYQYDRYWSQYMITGGMHDWAGALGIASITPELATGELPEVAENLAAIQAILAEADKLLPELTPIVEGSSQVEMPAPLWRYWRMQSNPELLGGPISPLVMLNDQATMFFSHYHLVLHNDGTWPLVERREGGYERWAEYLLDAPTSPYQLR